VIGDVTGYGLRVTGYGHDTSHRPVDPSEAVEVNSARVEPL
jgi:hypothetical protein